MSDRVTGSAGGGAGRRLRRFEERFEPVVTRVLLLGIFVTGLLAQFDDLLSLAKRPDWRQNSAA
jgi:hypothetical protein